jgi:chlorobactene glucosyltransferase
VLVVLLKVVLALWALRALNVALSILLVPRLAPATRREEGATFVSIVVPARNEERDIEDATRTKCRQDDPSFEVVVVDDRSSDGTRRLLAGLEREFPGVLRVVDGVEPPADWLGKPHALDEGARTARAQAPFEWLLFSDADVHFEPDVLARALAHAERERLDFVSVFPALEMRSLGEKLMAPSVANMGFCYLPGWLMNLPRARLFGGGAGVFNLIRRDHYERIGGHAALRNSVVDDIQLGRRARLAGGRTGGAWALDVVSVRMYHGFRETAKGFAKNGYYGMGANLLTAVLSLILFFLEGVLPFFVLAAGALDGWRTIAVLQSTRSNAAPAFFTFKEILLATVVITLTLLVRGALHLKLRYPLIGVVLHPVWVAAITGIFAWSTFVNGVLGRNEWRGRVRDAGTLEF